MFTVNSKPVSAKVAVVLVAVVVVFAASLLCGAQPAWADSVQYVEKSWDGTKVVSTTKTKESTHILPDTVNLNGWYYVTGTIENGNRLVVEEGAEANHPREMMINCHSER